MKVVISNLSSFYMSDMAVEECIRRGMTWAKWDDQVEDQRKHHFLLKSERDKFGRKTGSYYITSYTDVRANEFRSHPILVSVVEELGEKANGFTGKLKVIEIPFETAEGWRIHESDFGNGEWIEENHRSWS